MGAPRDTPLTPPSKVLASATTGVVRFIESHNGDVDSIFGRATIDLDDIDSPFNELRLEQYCLLFEEAAKQTGFGNFGLHFGQQFKPRQLGAIGYAAISAPTLGAALRHMQEHFPAHQSQTTFTVAERDIVSERYNDVLWLSYRIFDERFTHKRQDAELSLGMFCNIFRHALGNDWSPLEVCFEHPAPDGADEHTTCFGAPVRFNARTNAIAFRRSDLDTPMPEADPYLYSIVESFLKSRCQVEPSPEDVAAVIRDTIKLNLNERTPTATEVARMMGLTGYGLRKLLRSHGLSFQDLLRAARQDLALKYMADPEVSLTDIALVLGYSELSAFSRAFHAWTGMSPQRYRSAVALKALKGVRPL